MSKPSEDLPQTQQTASVYAVDKLMEETRRLAKDYRETTGQALPITSDLARYDCERLLQLVKPEEPLSGVDLVGDASTDWYEKCVQVKGRVIFDEQKTNQRIGQLNMEGDWDTVMLILFDADYQPTHIYACDRKPLEADLSKSDPSSSRQKRGPLSVARFKALSELVWMAGA